MSLADYPGNVVSPTRNTVLKRSCLSRPGMEKIPFPVKHVAATVWERLLNDEQRRQLGDDFKSAYRNPYRTAGMWAVAHGISAERAVIDLATELQMIPIFDARWLAQRLSIDPDGCSRDLENAIAAGHLVLCTNPKRLFWDGSPVELLGGTRPWEYFWQLALHRKRGAILDRAVLGDDLGVRYLDHMKCRLINDCGLPLELGERIINVESHCQRLDLDRNRIRIFEVENRNAWRELRCTSRQS